MKKILFVLTLVFCASVLQAQEQNNPAAKLAHHIADKMKDSLGLTNLQRAQVFQINMDLYKQKLSARKKSTDRTVVGAEMQQVEKSRDSLYQQVLTEQQYALYKQKKRNLVTTK